MKMKQNGHFTFQKLIVGVYLTPIVVVTELIAYIGASLIALHL